MEGIFIFEALLVLAILGYQLYVYRNNKVKIELIKNLFPSEEQLSVTETLLDHTAPAVATTTQTTEQLWTSLLAGKPFREFTPSNPAVKRIVSVENDLLHIEAKGGPVPAYTIARDKFDKLVTGHNIYLVQGDPDALVSSVSSGGKGAATIDLIEVRNPSETFSKIIKNTNEYLKRNKGAAADFDILKDVSERYSEALDAEVQSTVTTPLYIGLLGTFSGVIIGLSSLIWSGFTADEGSAAGSFITDQNIPSFLFGVMIAMAGSFCGLLLTLMGNHDLKNARSIRDRRQNDYYTFLQTHLLPKLNSDMAASLSNLKSVLDSFNRDFLDKVLGFRPIVDTLTENISTQKEFIEKLDKIGFTQMANANLQVFDKMKESEQLFKNFMQYQVALNESVQKGAELTHTISDVLGRLTSLQEGFDKVPGYLQKHDESIQRQVNFFGQHERELDDIGSRIEQYFDKAALRLTDLMEARLQHQERDAQNAYEKWQEHFRNLNEDNIYQRILDYMQPFENLNQQQERLNTTQQQLFGEIQQTNERLLQKIEADSVIQQQLLQQLHTLNTLMVKSMEPGPFKAALGKIFGGGNNRR